MLQQLAVALVIKFPADLENIKLSWETPIPRAPPSDFWSIKIQVLKQANIIKY